MNWLRSQDPEGYPAWFVTFGKHSAYVTGSFEIRDKPTGVMSWHSVQIYTSASLDDPEIMDRYACPLKEFSQIIEETAWDSPPVKSVPLITSLIRNFIDEACEERCKEIAELQQARP